VSDTGRVRTGVFTDSVVQALLPVSCIWEVETDSEMDMHIGLVFFVAFTALGE